MRETKPIGGTLEDATIDALTDTFEDIPEFEIVYVNFDYDLPIKTQISNGNKDDKIVGYKTLLSYPYDKIMFKIGDYVNFNYDHVNVGDYGGYSTWIIESLDTRKKYNVNGRIYPCNQILKWIDENNELKSYYCHIEEFMGATSLNMGNKGVVQEDGRFPIIVQNNEDVKKIRVNDRFSLSERTYVVTQKNEHINKGIVTLFVVKASELPMDDLEDNVAYNGEQYEDSKNGVLFSPFFDKITINETIEFDIYNYVDNVAQDETFSYKIEGDVPTENYEIVDIDGNRYSLKNKKEYKKNMLNITFIGNLSKKEATLSVWLRGVF